MSTLDLTRSPYFDTFDANDNYHQVLFRPAAAVQTREMNEIQSILQDQVAKFGRNIFKDGSVTEGCNFAFDNRYSFVKINDNYANGTAFVIADFQNQYLRNVNGLLATIINIVSGYQSQDPDVNTLYIKYLNSTTYPNGSQQSVFSNSEQLTLMTNENIPLGNVVVFTPNTANPTNSVATGLGYALTVSKGTLFKDGYFIGIKPQVAIVDKYNNKPDGVSVGFSLKENIVTPEANSSLHDNAGGSTNFSAPGAHRYQIIPELITMQTNNITNAVSFFSLCDFQDGIPVTIKTDSQYAVLGAEMARRGYETNGDFVVHPFILTTEPKDLEDPLFATHDNLVSSLGLGYVKGYRNEFLASVTAPLRKATNYANSLGTVVTASLGAYISVSNYCGDFNLDGLSQIELHTGNNYAVTNNVFLTAPYDANTLIGYAYLKGFSYSSGEIGTGVETYNAYIFNIKMNSGSSFSKVNKLVYHSGVNILGIADVIQAYNATTNTYGTVLTNPSSDMMIFPTGQKALKLDGFQNQSYVYRKRANSSFSNTVSGSMIITLRAPIGSAVENYDTGGYLGSGAEKSFTVVPTSNGISTDKTGTVNAISSSQTVTGTGTAFLSEYYNGDYIKINNYISQILQVSNNSSLTLSKPYAGTTATTNTHCKSFPRGVPISFERAGRSITVAGNVATFVLNEALSQSFNVAAYFDVFRNHTTSIQKTLKRNVHVAIDCGSHPNSTKGPFSLGLADAYKVNAIYINDGSYANNVADYSYLFKFDNGQRNDRYETASIMPISSVLKSSTRILVDLDIFTYDQSQGVGYFNGNSYPVDDINTSNTLALQTQYIPTYTSTTGFTFDLRDSIDFRPFANNSADTTANSLNWETTATINPSGNLVFYVNPSYGTFLPVPDHNYTADVQYYLSRIDKAILTTGGIFTIIEGVPSAKPAAPLDIASAMTLGIINVPPYPTLSTPDAKISGRYDYAVTTSLTQNQRFSMADIGALSGRVAQLEYYTSLNLLEQQAKNTQIISSSSQLNRFQNGFLVDSFQGTNIVDTLDPTFNCSIDPIRQEMRPAFSTFTKSLWTNMEDVPFSENLYIEQPYSCIAISTTVSPYCYFGRIELRPQLICSPDFFQDPDITNNLDLNASWINISCRPEPNSNDWRNPYGTEWEHWRHYSVLLANQHTGVGSGNTDSYGNILNDYQSRSTSNTGASGLYVGSSGSSSSEYNSNGISIDTDIIDFVRCRDIDFIARGLKPSTSVRMFVGTYELTNLVRQCSKGFAEETINNYGNTIITDTTGTVYGVVTIPSGYFKEGSIQFTLLDDPQNITTRADGYLQTSFVDSNNWKDIDIADQIADYELSSGLSPTYLPGKTLIRIANTDFLNARTQGTTDMNIWKTYFSGNTTWQRFPSKAGTLNRDNDWNPAYFAQDGYHSFDRKGADVGRVSYGVTPQTLNR